MLTCSDRQQTAGLTASRTAKIYSTTDASTNILYTQPTYCSTNTHGDAVHTTGPRTSQWCQYDVNIDAYTDTSTEQWYKYIQYCGRQQDHQHYLTCIFDTDKNT